MAKHLLALPILLLALVSLGLTDDVDVVEERPAERVFSQQELDQMLAPIALYPDSLLAQILMASTYPAEVFEAAHWSRANPGLSGERAVQAVERQNWDPSVKALVAFPQILAQMYERMQWTEELGDAFLAQQAQVMETVQALRQKAYDAGNLRSSEYYAVENQGDDIVIQPASPQVVYVPYYDPLVVYGPWWWSAYPVYWAPWPGYYWRPGHGGYYHTTVSVFVGPRFYYSRCDWPRRRLFTHGSAAAIAWRHDPAHRRDVAYRHPSVQQKFAQRPAPPLKREYLARPAPDMRPRPEPRAETAPKAQYQPRPQVSGVAPRADAVMSPAVGMQKPDARQRYGAIPAAPTPVARRDELRFHTMQPRGDMPPAASLHGSANIPPTPRNILAAPARPVPVPQPDVRRDAPAPAAPPAASASVPRIESKIPDVKSSQPVPSGAPAMSFGDKRGIAEMLRR